MAEVRSLFAYAAKVDADEYAAAVKSVKAMDPFDDTLGGTLVPFPIQGPLVALLRTLAVVSAAGAQEVPLPPNGSIIYPKEQSDATFQWLSPNVAITDSDKSTGELTLTAKRAGALVKLPNDLIRFSSGVAESIVRGSLVQRAAL